MDVKVIFHINEMDKWQGLLHNAANLLAAYEGDEKTLIVEVLANGGAVGGYLLGARDIEAMKGLADQGVVFAACSNALKGQGIAADRLASFVAVVPAGVRELADRQMEGYAYIKP